MSYATNLEAPSKIGTKETFLLCTEKWENRFCKSCEFEPEIAWSWCGHFFGIDEPYCVKESIPVTWGFAVCSGEWKDIV